MRHFPVFLATEAQRIAVVGGGEAALAKLRLVLKTSAAVTVFAREPMLPIRNWEAEGRLTLVPSLPDSDSALAGYRLVYVATGSTRTDRAIAAEARRHGALVNIVDDLEGSDFITPAMVDRDPVIVAIGTEGAAPVLARRLKARIEAMLPTGTGALARAGRAFRTAAATLLPPGRTRRLFWDRFYGTVGPEVLAHGGEAALGPALRALVRDIQGGPGLPGSMTLVAAGGGDPDDLSARARRALDEADLVVVNPGTPDAFLELARREARIVAPDADGLGDALKAAACEARQGAAVVALAPGDGLSMAAIARRSAAALGAPSPLLLRAAALPLAVPDAANADTAPRPAFPVNTHPQRKP